MGEIKPVPSQPQPIDSFDRQALRDFARSRVDGLPGRVIFYTLAAGAAATAIPAVGLMICTGLIAATTFAEYRAAQTLLSVDNSGSGGTDLSHKNLLIGSHAATSIAVAFVIAAIWGLTGRDANLLATSLMAIAILDAVLTSHQILRLIMLRQILLVGTAIAMTLRDILLTDGVTLHSLGASLLPVLLFATIALSASHTRAKAYRDQFIRERALADARDTAEQANVRRGNFTAIISHEIRTQLNGVLGMAKNLVKTNLTAEQRQQAGVITESAQSLNTLLNDILDYSKLETGRLTIEPTAQDLRGTIEHISRLFGPLAVEKGLEFYVVVGPEIPARLMFDPVRVRQCLANLISNAIKFTHSGSLRVTVSGEVIGTGPDGTPRYSISAIIADTGIGIPVESQAQLFQPFTQAHVNISRQFGGTGLGLSITRQLAESMGGSAFLEHTSDKGSVFRLTFAADGTRGASNDRPGDGPPPMLTDRRVLIADDTESSRMVMRLFLRPLGVQVVEVADGAAALDALAGSRFDAAFLDLNMPGMGGAEIAQRIRLGEAGPPDLPLLAISADSALSGVSIGDGIFDAVIVKPVDLCDLQITLAGAIQRSKQEARPVPGPETSSGDSNSG